jgi:hypothetical protein
VAVRVGEVHAPTAVVVVDLALPSADRVGVVVDAALLDAPEDLVELGFGDEEGVVLQVAVWGLSRAVDLVEVEVDAVARRHLAEVPEPLGWREAEQVRVPGR